MTPTTAPSMIARRPMVPAMRPLVLALLLGCAAAAGAQPAPAAAAAAGASAASAPMLSAEVAKPLQAAQQAIRAGNYKEALAHVGEAEAMPGRNPYEIYLTQRLKAPAQFGMGDQAGALATYEAALASPALPAADRDLVLETTIRLALQLKDYERARRWMKIYLVEGGNDPEIRRRYPRVLFELGDNAGVVAELAPLVAADAAAKRATDEETLKLLAISQNALKDETGYLATVARLAGSTGKAEYWSDLIARLVDRKGFADERLRIDAYRLMNAVGVPLSPSQTGDWADRASRAGLPAEAQKLLDDGFASGLLGKDANAEADRKLRESSTKAAKQEMATLADNEAAALKAKDGNAAVGQGLSLSGAGLNDKALNLMNQGIAKGGLRAPDDAMLHLGLVQWRAGRLDDARRSFAAVRGSDGAADLARLWTIYLDSPARK